MRDSCDRPLVSTPLAWSSELLERLNASASVLASVRSPVRWANGPMAGQEPSRVPPPHEVGPPAAHVAGAFAAARPKPLWQPWSDSDDDRDRAVDGGQKELPTRIKKERRRHERHHDLISTAARARKEKPVPEEADDDRPLDMTVNRRSSPPPYRYPSPSDYSGRPSVITCASTSSVRSSPGCASPCGSTGSARSSSNLSPRPSADAPDAAAGAGGGGRPHRREIISSGVCDPVIDEHFRRSLGERYSHLFANNSPASPSAGSNATSGSPSDSASVSGSRDGSSAKLPSTLNVTGLSVDDHFAKALGETWLKLQSETKEKESTGDPQPGSPLPSSAQRQGLLLT